jgi:RHH-type transcriptional regulator, rel operon repressor / antitoxin RelB
LAHASGHDKAFYVLEAIREQLDDIEDGCLAATVTEDIREGRMKTYSLAETRRTLGLDD